MFRGLMKKIIAVFYITITTLTLNFYGMKNFNKELFKKSDNIFTNGNLIKKSWRNYSAWNHIKSPNSVTKVPTKNVSNNTLILDKNINSMPIIKSEFSTPMQLTERPGKKTFSSNNSKKSPFKKGNTFNFFKTKVQSETKELGNRLYSTVPTENELHTQESLSYAVRSKDGDWKAIELKKILDYFLDILKKGYGKGNESNLKYTFKVLKNRYTPKKKIDISDTYSGDMRRRERARFLKEIEADREIQELVYKAYQLFKDEIKTKTLDHFIEILKSAKKISNKALNETFDSLLKQYKNEEDFEDLPSNFTINRTLINHENEAIRNLINEAYKIVNNDTQEEILNLKIKKDNP